MPTTTPTALLYFSPHCPACHLSYTLDEAPTRSPYAAAPPHQPNALFGTQVSKGTKTTLYFLFTSITKHAVLSSIVLSLFSLKIYKGIQHIGDGKSQL